jgi:2-(1,2-epoxy-1,2-dihydrophenyl)acetyl-CoA isomerase
MSDTGIHFELKAGVARLTLNRPDKLNALTSAMHAEIRHALAQLQSEPKARVLLLTGAGRGFCAGQNLEDSSIAPDGAAVDLGAIIERDYAPLVRTLRALPLPVLCAVNGVAAGAGANLAFACDIVIAKHSAFFVEPFCKIGLIPDTGGTYFLPRLIGTARAMGLALLGPKIPATQAAEWGLIWKCVADDEFDAEIHAMAAHLAAAPTLALARAKQAIYSSAHATLDEQLIAERDAMRELGFTREYRESVASFLNKRTPESHGH